MTGEASGEASRVDEDPFEEQMRLTNETSAEQLTASTAPRYVKPQALDARSCQPNVTSLGCGDSSMVVLHLEAG